MKIIIESVRICSKCFTNISRGCRYLASRCQYSRRFTVANLKVEEVKKKLFSSSVFSDLQQGLGLSNSKTKVLLSNIRLVSGSRFITEKNSFAKIHQDNHQLDKFFQLQKLVYCREDKDTKIIKNIEIPTIVYSQLPSLIKRILQKRQSERKSLFLNLRIDGDGGFV